MVKQRIELYEDYDEDDDDEEEVEIAEVHEEEVAAEEDEEEMMPEERKYCSRCLHGNVLNKIFRSVHLSLLNNINLERNTEGVI